jgi:hypothetical protein
MGVEFEEENISNQVETQRVSAALSKAKVSRMTGFLIKLGLVKNEKQATYVFVATFVLAVLAALLILNYNNPATPKYTVPEGYKIVTSPGEPITLEPVDQQ